MFGHSSCCLNKVSCLSSVYNHCNYWFTSFDILTIPMVTLEGGGVSHWLHDKVWEIPGVDNKFCGLATSDGGGGNIFFW